MQLFIIDLLLSYKLTHALLSDSTNTVVTFRAIVDWSSSLFSTCVIVKITFANWGDLNQGGEDRKIKLYEGK